MCGLWLRNEPVPAAVLVGMRDSLEHRGPDAASGVLLSSRTGCSVSFDDGAPDLAPGEHDVGLGHRRLSIIDLAGGRQPMSSADGSIWLVYNGEVYNYRELRRELVAAGHEFRTQSDTEVVLRAYEHWGEECQAYLNGIFAFAIWDGNQRRLLLARDEFGVKPLYYACTSRGVAFGSEVKAILLSGLARPAVDLDALGVALTFRYTPSPATLFRDVRKVVPGSSLIVEPDGSVSERFFGYATSDRRGPDAREWPGRLAREIDSAVHRQMVSDVPIGLSLSSGVDSSTLLAVMSRWSAEPVRAFTVGFTENGRDNEVPLAKGLARRFTAQFRAMKVGGDEYSAFMQRYMRHMEEPVGNQSAPAYYFVAAMAREAGVKVLLTGQGPDELFAGYDRHVGIAFSRLLRATALPSVQSQVRRATLGREIGEKYLRFLTTASHSDLARRLHGAYSVFSPQEARDLLAPDVYESIDWSLSLAHVERWLRRAPSGTDLERMLWIDARTLLADNLLLAEDKMAMAVGVEARVPFLDLEFARLAEAVPGSMKLRLGRRKHVYRRACAHWVGAEQSRRRKIGFANPMAEWFRGSYQSSILAPLADRDSFLATYTRPGAVRRMVREHQERRRDHTRKLYFLASLEAWHETFCR